MAAAARVASVAALLLGLSAWAAVAESNADESLAVIAHPDVAERRIDAATIEGIFTASRRSWGDGSAIIPFNYAPDDPLRRLFDRVVLGLTPQQAGQFWVDQRVRGNGTPPRQVPDPVQVVRLVALLPGSIAYVPDRYVDKSVRVVARVRGGKVVPP